MGNLRVNLSGVLVLLFGSTLCGQSFQESPPVPTPAPEPISVPKPIAVAKPIKPIVVPEPPAFPQEDAELLVPEELPPIPDPKPEPLPTPTQATRVDSLPSEELSPTSQVRDVNGSTAQDQVSLPDQRQLVSILKQKLPESNETVAVQEVPEWFQNLMQRIVRENIPDKYVQEKDWGKTDRRWDGLHVKRRGTFDWTTKRRWKDVNHGTWKRYEVSQISPEENLTMRIENVHDAGQGKVGFGIRLTSRLHVMGRLAKWNKGVQLYNISADADAYVELAMQCTIGIRLDIAKFPPDVLLTPNVSQADVDVKEFQLHQLSKLRGPLVKELSGSVRRALLEKIDEKRERLPSKINRQIAKNQDKLRLSLADFASEKWASLTASSDPSSSTDAKTDAAESSAQRPPVESDPLRSARLPVASRKASRADREPVQLLNLMPPEGAPMLR